MVLRQISYRLRASYRGVYRLQVSAYARATRCPVLTSRIVLPVSFNLLLPLILVSSLSSYAMLSTDIRASYAMSGTHLVHCSICLRACYVMPGTDFA
eukprot:872048-Rhodomonas_salina.2